MMQRMITGGLISAALVLPILLFFWNKQASLKKKLGRIHAELGVNKSTKLYKYRYVGLLAGWMVGMGVYYLLGRLIDQHEERGLNPIGFGIMMLTTSFITQPRPTTFGENGFTPFGRFTFYAWSDIERIEWDRDLGQVEWSYKIFLKNSNTPVKASVWRQTQPEAAELFKRFLKTEKEPEAVTT